MKTNIDLSPVASQIVEAIEHLDAVCNVADNLDLTRTNFTEDEHKELIDALNVVHHHLHLLAGYALLNDAK